MADCCNKGYGGDGYGGFESEVGNLCKYIGQTVTIFTASGGVSGCGFTGVLMSANECYVRLLTCIGSAPACPVGSNCCDVDTCCSNKHDFCCNSCGNSCGGGNYYNVGSVVVIPVDRIVSFCHNAI